MTHDRHPLNRHYESAKAHLAGVKAAEVWRQELIDAHLLRHPKPGDPPPTPPAVDGH